jgi:anti-sigma B factor antagonist
LPSPEFTVESSSLELLEEGRVSFSVNVRQAEGISLIEIKGRLTSFESRALREMMHSLINGGHTNFVLNLTDLDYLDSSGVGELARNYLSIVKKGGTMKVVGLAAKVEEILKVTQLSRVFPEFPDEASALESFPETGGHASA